MRKLQKLFARLRDFRQSLRSHAMPMMVFEAYAMHRSAVAMRTALLSKILRAQNAHADHCDIQLRFRSICECECVLTFQISLSDAPLHVLDNRTDTKAQRLL